jgi:hypothetical protein
VLIVLVLSQTGAQRRLLGLDVLAGDGLAIIVPTIVPDLLPGRVDCVQRRVDRLQAAPSPRPVTGLGLTVVGLEHHLLR